MVDGDNNNCSHTLFKAVGVQLSNKLPNETVSVISVTGLQSTGKSTLLNCLYNLDFAVSGNRTTKGVHLQLIKNNSQSGNQNNEKRPGYFFLMDWVHFYATF